MYNGLPGTPTPSPHDASRGVRGGRGRGRGRGTGSGSFRVPRGGGEAGRPLPSATSPAGTKPPGSHLPARGRHSSYTPSAGRPASPGSSPTPSRTTPAAPVRRGRGGGTGTGRVLPPVAGEASAPIRPNPAVRPVRPVSASVGSVAPRQLPPPSALMNSAPTASRALPKFSDVSGDDDEPTPPPRSPVVSPRMANLPKLPERPALLGSQPVAVAPATVAGSPPPESKVMSPEKEARRAENRRRCVAEIHSTERDYIEDLEILINVFIFPMRTMAIVDDKALYSIFSNVEVLINCNKEMLSQLETITTEASHTSGDDVTIGAVFTQLADYFKMYKVFCANQNTSLAAVEQLTKKNTAFRKNLDVCHSDPRCRGLFLQSFLIKPIQRVCKYPLLLRDLIGYTPETHPDWVPLQAAFEKINSVVADINEAQRQAEGLQRILDLQKLIDGVDSLVAPGRKYVKEGELTQYKSSKSKNGEKRHVFFFTDLILLTLKKGDKKFDHKLSVGLDSCKLVVLADSSYIKNSFELSSDSLPKGKKCILSGETPEDSNQWIKEIRGLIKSYQKRKLLEMEDQRRNGLVPIDRD